MKTLIALILALSAGAAVAQQCSHYYDANKQRFCYICMTPGGTPVVTCH